MRGRHRCRFQRVILLILLITGDVYDLLLLLRAMKPDRVSYVGYCMRILSNGHSRSALGQHPRWCRSNMVVVYVTI